MPSPRSTTRTSSRLQGAHAPREVEVAPGFAGWGPGRPRGRPRCRPPHRQRPAGWWGGGDRGGGSREVGGCCGREMGRMGPRGFGCTPKDSRIVPPSVLPPSLPHTRLPPPGSFPPLPGPPPPRPPPWPKPAQPTRRSPRSWVGGVCTVADGATGAGSRCPALPTQFQSSPPPRLSGVSASHPNSSFARRAAHRYSMWGLGLLTSWSPGAAPCASPRTEGRSSLVMSSAGGKPGGRAGASKDREGDRTLGTQPVCSLEDAGPVPPPLDPPFDF